MTKKEWWLRQAARALGFGTVLSVVGLASAAMGIYEFYQQGWWLRQVAPHLLLMLAFAAVLLLGLSLVAKAVTRGQWGPALGRTAKAFRAGALFGTVAIAAVLLLIQAFFGF